jgi:aryl-alcohol dehydrogenase-like predicted oxidoreductase
MTASTVFAGDDLRQRDPKFREPRYRQYLAAAAALKTLARERFAKSLPALAARWVLDQGPTIALWGARRPAQLDPIDEVAGWRLDVESKADIEAILKRCITDPVSPEFIAPPTSRPSDQGLRRHG